MKVKIPNLPALPKSTRIAKQIRKNILRDEFGFTDADIEEFDKKYSDILKIQTDANPRQWATNKQFEQSRNALPDKIISITIEESAVLQVESFRAQRASFEALKAGAFITDAVVRQKIVGDLETILTSWGQKRIDALGDLMVEAVGSPAKMQICQALRFLLNESGYKNNPFLLLAVAQATLTPQFGVNELDLAAIAKAVQAANESFYYDSSKTDFAKMSGQEAAMINNWAGTLYQNIHADNNAVKRRKIERLFGMSIDERNSLKEGDSISIYATNENVVTVPSANKMELNKLDIDWDQQQVREQEINTIGNEIPPTDPQYNEYFVYQNDKVEVKDYRVKQKDRVMANGKKRPKFKYVTLSQPVNTLGARVDKEGNAVTLLLELYRYAGASRRMGELAHYYGRRGQLSNRIEGEQTIIIPPRPEIIEQAMSELRQYGRINSSKGMKQQNIFLILNDLEYILEQSNAFYKVQK